MCFEGESPEFFVQHVRKARKAHKCYECRQPIVPGEHYYYTAGKWNGEVDSFRTCVRCERLRSEIVAHELKEGCSSEEASPPFGCLMEAIRQGEMS